jgi:phosphoribosylanthranilate isomerase
VNPRIKICCIGNRYEADTAIAAGASAIGLVGRMPSGPGVIDDSLICEIARTTPPPIGVFLLTCETTAEEIIAHHHRAPTNTIQLVDLPESGAYRILRETMPAVKLVQVIHVLGEQSIEVALAAAQEVDAILLDSGNPNLPVRELGGTGRTHDWKLSRTICELSPVPVFLAGGLNPENVAQAVEAVRPFGLDVCSGVRTGGKLDPRKLEAFTRNAQG